MMADSFYYNQEVKAQMINDIAIDLGHTSFNGFGAEKFGVAELNNITRDIVSKGILQTDERCRAIYTDGVIHIQPGVIVFEDGAKKKIESAITFTSQGSGVIYALNDTAAGKASIIYGDAYPVGGDYIKICEVTASGVADHREFAKTKIELASGNYKVQKNISVQILKDSVPVTATKYDGYDIDKTEYIIFTGELAHLKVSKLSAIKRGWLMFWDGDHYDIYVTLHLNDDGSYDLMFKGTRNADIVLDVTLI